MMKNFRIKYNRLFQILGFAMVFVNSMLGMVFLFIPRSVEYLNGMSLFILGILFIHFAVFIVYHIIKQTLKDGGNEMIFSFHVVNSCRIIKVKR
jgi:hypothetical protein